MDRDIGHVDTARDDELGVVTDSAVKLLMVSLLPREGGGAEGDGG